MGQLLRQEVGWGLEVFASKIMSQVGLPVGVKSRVVGEVGGVR